jgi:acylphosphatase
MLTKHLIITGRVQGVGFRNYMAFKARQFHIHGWVRNRTDGSVEAVIQGQAADVEAVIVRAHRGPPKSAVTKVTVSDTTGNYSGFETRPTA